MPTTAKYTIFIKNVGKTQEIKTDSIADGLALIDLPTIIKGPFWLYISNGEKQTPPKLINPPRIKRIKTNKIFRAILEKQFKTFLEG